MKHPGNSNTLCNTTMNGTETKPERRPQDQPGCVDGVVLYLPDDRKELCADLRLIDQQCSEVLCDIHRKLFSRLVKIPREILLAGARLIKGESAETANTWAETLLLYVTVIAERKNDIIAAASFQDNLEAGKQAAEAISAVEKVAPAFVSAAVFPVAAGELNRCTRELARASKILHERLNELLHAAKMSTRQTRASQLVRMCSGYAPASSESVPTNPISKSQTHSFDERR